MKMHYLITIRTVCYLNSHIDHAHSGHFKMIESYRLNTLLGKHGLIDSFGFKEEIDY